MSGNGTILIPSGPGLFPDLAEEITQGKLRLRADTFLRSAFSFSLGNYPIGLFAIQSNGPGDISLLRRWDQEKKTFDPINNLTVMNRGRQFGKLSQGEILFLVEYTTDLAMAVAKVAFKFKRVHTYNAELPGAPDGFRFEGADLFEVEIVG